MVAEVHSEGFVANVIRASDCSLLVTGAVEGTSHQDCHNIYSTGIHK